MSGLIRATQLALVIKFRSREVRTMVGDKGAIEVQLLEAVELERGQVVDPEIADEGVGEVHLSHCGGRALAQNAPQIEVGEVKATQIKVTPIVPEEIAEPF